MSKKPPKLSRPVFDRLVADVAARYRVALQEAWPLIEEAKAAGDAKRAEALAEAALSSATDGACELVSRAIAAKVKGLH